MSSSSYARGAGYLVAKSLPSQAPAVQFPTMGLRAWFAWQALPRGPEGQPPARRALEREHDLPNGMLAKIIWDQSDPTVTVLRKAAAALRCTVGWLANEEGQGPSTQWQIPVRPPKPSARKTVAKPATPRRDKLSDRIPAEHYASKSVVLDVDNSGPEDPPSGPSVEGSNKLKPAKSKHRSQ